MTKNLRPRQNPRVAVFVDMLSEYGRDILVGVSGYLRTHEPWTVFGDPERVVAPIKQLERWEGEGIIAHLSRHALLAVVQRATSPVVNVSEHIPGLALTSVLPDNQAVGSSAADYFLERGYDSLAYCGFTGHRYSEVRYEAYSARLAEQGRQCRRYDSSPPQERISRWQHRQQQLAKWVASLPRPAAVFCCNDARARHVADASRLAGLRVPEDVSILGVDNDELICEMSSPPLSSVDVDAQRVGYEAAALLDRLMRGEPAPAKPVRVPPLGIVTRRSSDMMAVADADVSAALRFIHDHARRPIQVDDVVAATNASRRVLERRFLATLNRTIGKEIANTRLARARELLIHTELPATDVAQRCGFGYVQQFNALFRRELEMTPTEFRRRHRQGVAQ